MHYLKVSKSQKQERWGNCQYINCPSICFLEESRTTYFVFEIFWPLISNLRLQELCLWKVYVLSLSLEPVCCKRWQKKMVPDPQYDGLRITYIAAIIPSCFWILVPFFTNHCWLNMTKTAWNWKIWWTFKPEGQPYPDWTQIRTLGAWPNPKSGFSLG
jgi:hypothetical protein